MAEHQHPQWWSTQQTSTWERVKEALSRDWEQTKADFSNEYGKDLDQNAGDTLKQAIGTEPIPAPHQKTPADNSSGDARREAPQWTDAEPAIRYGYGAAHHYGDHKGWDDKVEDKLKGEWSDMRSGRTWNEAKSHVRYGWDRARNAVVRKD